MATKIETRAKMCSLQTKLTTILQEIVNLRSKAWGLRIHSRFLVRAWETMQKWTLSLSTVLLQLWFHHKIHKIVTPERKIVVNLIDLANSSSSRSNSSNSCPQSILLPPTAATKVNHKRCMQRLRFLHTIQSRNPSKTFRISQWAAAWSTSTCRIRLLPATTSTSNKSSKVSIWAYTR